VEPAAATTKDEFKDWQEGFLTKSVLDAMLRHASEEKIRVLSEIWDTSDPEQLTILSQYKDKLRVRIETIQDLREMEYDDFISYFKKG